MIEVSNIQKTFKVARRDAGFSNAVKALFHKEYDLVKALDGISFTIGDGEMVGYIGPNGAGKSSTIKVLSGILTPDSGECRINGRVPWRERPAACEGNRRRVRPAVAAVVGRAHNRFL